MNRLNPNLLYEITSNYLCGKYFSSIPKISLTNRDFYHAFIAHFRHIRVLYLVEEEEDRSISLKNRFPANESGDFVIINTIDLIREQNLAQLDTLDELYPSYNLHTTFAVFNCLLKLRCIQTIDYLSLTRHYPLSLTHDYPLGYKDYYARGREDTNMHHLIQHLHDAKLKISYFYVHCDDHPDVWKSFNCLLHQQEPVAIEFVRNQRVLQCLSPEVQIDYLNIYLFYYEKMSKPLKTKVLRLRHHSIARLMKVLEMVQTDCLQIETRDDTEDLMKLTVNTEYGPLINNIKKVLWYSKDPGFFIPSEGRALDTSLSCRLPSPGFLFICENMNSLQDLLVEIEYDLDEYYQNDEIKTIANLLLDYTSIMAELEKMFISASNKMHALNKLDINLIIKCSPSKLCSREEEMLIFIKKILLMIQQLNLKELFDGGLEASLIYKMLPEEECCFKMDSITKLPNKLTNFFGKELCFCLSKESTKVSVDFSFIFK